MRSTFAALLIGWLWTPAPAQDEREAPPPVLDPGAAGPAQQIWSKTADAATVFFRREFELPERARRIRLVASCDDLCTVFVNGRQIAAAQAWETLIVADLADAAAGRNVVAVQGGNRMGPASLAVWLLWEDERGARHCLVSDGEWRCSIDEAEGWEQPGFDHSAWERAGESGPTPFGRTVYGMEPVGYVIVDRFTEMADAIERALREMRAAEGDDEAALRSLAQIERAVVRARQAVWERRTKKEEKETGEKGAGKDAGKAGGKDAGKAAGKAGGN